MCGIAGFNESVLRKVNAERVLEDMGEAISHRGPDSGVSFLSDSVGLRHQRLSIIDTSERGSQPMLSPSGRYITVFNGEIYNFMTLRNQLANDGVKFRGQSDTEVLLALYERFGSKCLEMLNGMFAVAIWDKQSRSLFLARDRLGKKPLYFWREGDKFAFASEIKALLKIDCVQKKLRWDAVKDYFTFHYVPDPKTIFENIEKLPPGHKLLIDSNGNGQPQPWWNVSFVEKAEGNESDLKEELNFLIQDSVKMRMISDVPLGAFLSGGVDSSAIVSCMSKFSKEQVITCSVGFDSAKYDESNYARQLADQLGTRHNEYKVQGDISESIDQISKYFDEPFADASFLPSFFVSKMARKAVTVALAGDGGDESFGGYTKYASYEREIRWRSNLPNWLPSSYIARLSSLLSGTNIQGIQRGSNLLHSLSVKNDEGFFICNSFFRRDLWNALAIGTLDLATKGYLPQEKTCEIYNHADTDDPLAKALYTDIKTYLPGDILVKVDRMSMANSLECRAPLLDFRIVEFAASLPTDMKIRNGTSKFILKETLKKQLPSSIINRKKMGFESPVAIWLRGSLRSMFETRVFSKNSASNQLFKRELLVDLWNQHLSGSDLYVNELWSIFMFEQWWHHYILDET